MVERIDPVSGLLATMQVLAYGNPSRKDAFTDKIEGFAVDTCKGYDTGKWETGIKPAGKSWIIVSQYQNREEAVKGHATWVRALTDNPTQNLEDIDLWGLKEY